MIRGEEINLNLDLNIEKNRYKSVGSTGIGIAPILIDIKPIPAIKPPKPPTIILKKLL